MTHGDDLETLDDNEIVNELKELDEERAREKLAIKGLA